jgi:CheY-like chemotaxis protein
MSQRILILQRQTRLRTDFLSFIAHEIRNPLHGILGITTLLTNRRPPLPKEVLEHVDTINACGQMMRTVLDDVLDIQKIDKGMLRLEKVRFDLSQLVDRVDLLGNSLAVAQSVGWKCETFLEPGELLVEGDPTRIKQCLLNLISNAVKFSKNTGVVSLTVLRHATLPSTFVFIVQDQGIGMTKEAMAHIFVPFSQADSSIFRTFGGSGLGLSIVSSLTSRMHGTIDVESHEGQGTKFTFILPLRELADHERGDSKQGDQAQIVRKILLVDDDDYTREIGRMILDQYGFKVLTAVDGQEAIDHVFNLGSDDVDLILMDVVMPVKGGVEATKELRSRGCAIPIFGCTGSDSVIDRDECLKAGMDLVMVKPIQPAEMLQLFKLVKKRT